MAVETSTRTERGPLLGTETREARLPGPTSARVEVEWPRVRVTAEASELCRTETVETWAEERVTERATTATGPALATGLTNGLASAALFGLSFAFSGEPDTSSIDEAGRYGRSTRQTLQTVSVVTLAIAVPALVVAAIGAARSGVSTEVGRQETVVAQRDVRCGGHEATGRLTLVGAGGPIAQRSLEGGVAEFSAAEVSAPVQAVEVEGVAATLDEDARAALDGLAACARAERQMQPLESLSEDDLRVRASTLRECRGVRGEAVAPAIIAVDAALADARAPGAALQTPGFESYDDALRTLKPTLIFEKGSADAARLELPEVLEGQAAVLRGVVVERSGASVGVVQVGERQVYLSVPRGRDADFVEGARIEAVVVFAGSQALGRRTLPFARAAWVRAAF